MNTAIIIFAAVAFLLALLFGRNRPPKYRDGKVVKGPVKRRGF